MGLGDPRGTRGATDEERALFRAGFAEMLDRISPRLVVLYGEARDGLLPESADGVRIRSYPSRWSSIREERRRLSEEAMRA